MSGTLFTPPRFIPVNSSGRPYPGAKLYFYRAGTTTLATVYTTSALSVASANPLTANSAGMFDAVYLDPLGGDYKAVLQNSSGVQLWSEDNIPANPLTAQMVGQAIFPRSDAEISAGVTPADYGYEPGDSRRYSSLAQWASVGGALKLVGDYTISAALTFPSGAVVQGVSRPSVTVDTAGVRAFQCTGATGFEVHGVTLAGPGSSTAFATTYDGYEAASTGAITVTDSSDVRITDCEVSGFYNGISALNCDRVWIERNRVSSWYVYAIVASRCTDFSIDRNVLVGCDQNGAANAYGISATGDENAGTSTIQKACSISFNTIRDVPSWDGIMTHDVSGLRIIGNDIRNVRNGIDVGHVIANNYVRDIQVIGNLIESTTTDTWATAAALHCGILVTGYDATHLIDSVVVADNIVKGFFQTAGMVGSGNPSNISVVFCQYATVTGNIVRNAGSVISNAGVYIVANNDGVVVSGNSLQGTMAAGGVRFASVVATGAVIDGNTIRQATASDKGVYITSSTITGLVLGNNAGNSTSPVTVTGGTVTYAVRNAGATSVADGGTISHGLVSTPTRVIVTPSTASEFASVTAVGASNFTVALKKHDNTAGTTQTVYWQAEA